VTGRAPAHLAAAALTALAAAGCGSHQATSLGAMPGEPLGGEPSARPVAKDAATATAAVKPDRYTGAIEAASARGMRVWLEADLATRWLAGRAAFDDGVARLAQLGRLPGVVGFKIADELGYQDGFERDPAKLRQFLHDSAVALRRAAPGKLVLIDLIAPELGCGAFRPGAVPGAQTCAEKVRDKYPALRLEEVDKVASSGDVDVIDLRTFLQTPWAYTTWGTSVQEAQHAAWQEAIRRGWSRGLTLQSRKALAEPGGSDDSPGDAAASAALYIDIPRQEGAAGADIWTWRQTYQNKVVSLLGADYTPNPLWEQLRQRHDAGARLFTHFTPSSVHRNVAADLDVVRQAFTDVFVAAGIG
jgi:hypothetical protein